MPISEELRMHIAQAYLKDRIDADYRYIVERLAEGTLYGEPIDPENHKQLVVAAYNLGQCERRFYSLANPKGEKP